MEEARAKAIREAWNEQLRAQFGDAQSREDLNKKTQEAVSQAVEAEKKALREGFEEVQRRGQEMKRKEYEAQLAKEEGKSGR